MTNGFFAGGAAEGLTAGIATGSEAVGRGLKLGQGARALQLKEQEAQQTQRFKELQLVSKNIKSVEDSILKEVFEGRADPEQSKALYQRFAQGNAANFAALGQDPQSAVARVSSMIDAAFTPAQQGARAAAERGGEIAGVTAKPGGGPSIAEQEASLEQLKAEARQTGELQANRKIIGQILEDVGAPPLPTDESGQESPAITQPFGPGVAATPHAQAATRWLLASRRLFAAGLTEQANGALAQARVILDNSPQIQRQKDLDKPISDELAREFQVEAGTTYRDIMGQIPRSPEALAEEKAAGGARGRGRAEAQQQIGFIQEAAGILETFLGEVQKDPGIVGVRAKVRRFGQRATGTVKDLTEFARDLAFTQSELNLDEITGFFENPQLALLSVIENSVGMILARMRTPEGRIPVDVIQRSIQDVNLAGAEKSEDVVVRLNFVLNTLRNRSSRLGRQFGLEEPESSVPRFKVEGGKLVPIP